MVRTARHQSLENFMASAGEQSLSLGKLAAFDGTCAPFSCVHPNATPCFQAAFASLWSHLGEVPKCYVNLQLLTYTEECLRINQRLFKLDIDIPLARYKKNIIIRPDHGRSAIALAATLGPADLPQVVLASTSTNHSKLHHNS